MRGQLGGEADWVPVALSCLMTLRLVVSLIQQVISALIFELPIIIEASPSSWRLNPMHGSGFGPCYLGQSDVRLVSTCYQAIRLNQLLGSMPSIGNCVARPTGYIYCYGPHVLGLSIFFINIDSPTF